MIRLSPQAFLFVDEERDLIVYPAVIQNSEYIMQESGLLSNACLHLPALICGPRNNVGTLKGLKTFRKTRRLLTDLLVVFVCCLQAAISEIW